MPRVLLVFGPRSTTYDFGPGHPLTPRRFGPGLGLLRTLGAEAGVAPEPASDDELLRCHARRYLEVVKAFSRDPFGMPAAGIGHSDDPPFAGMHEAAASVAGGSLRAMEAILRGDVEHAFHPGGGLHHAMRERAAGFCIYNDAALAIARARREGLRVLYIDLDVHHGDGVQAIHADDPGVLTLSFHESGRYLFPGTGGVDELGEDDAAGTVVNVPLEPLTGEAPWLAAVEALVPEVAAAFGPDLIVSQHGADSHAWDPLAHLAVTTTAMGSAARLIDGIAHEHASGRWLATGGGGYDVYRVVPRAWSLVWLAGAHREVPPAIDATWRDTWAAEASQFGQAPLPPAFADPPNAGQPVGAAQAAAEARSAATVELVRRLVVPRLLRVARDRGWWVPAVTTPPQGSKWPGSLQGELVIHDVVDPASWTGWALAARVVAPADPVAGHAIVAAGLAGGLRATAAVAGGTVVGVVLSEVRDGGVVELLALGVTPARRGQGLARRLLAAHLTALGPERDVVAEVTLAERDPIDPADAGLRRGIARRLLTGAGFELELPDPALRLAEPAAIVARRAARPTAR